MSDIIAGIILVVALLSIAGVIVMIIKEWADCTESMEDLEKRVEKLEKRIETLEQPLK